MTSIFSVAFTTVLLAEMIGDKSLLLVIGFAGRFRRAAILLGMTGAMIVKVGVATIFGGLLVHVPRSFTNLLTGITFMAAAALLIVESGEERHIVQKERSQNPALVAFGAFLFSDWCDPGQIAVAALTVKYNAPLIVGLGATVALITRFTLVLVLGIHLLKFVPKEVLRYSMAVTLFFVGLLCWVSVVH